MFAVTGITGKVGGAVARSLLDAGLSVRAVVREAAKGSPWASRGCEVAIADLDDVAPLAAAFSGVGGAFAMLPPIFDPTPGFPEAKAMIGTLHAALAEAAPPKLVVLSTVGADATQPNLLNQLGLLERALADLPIRITFLRPGWFMENAAVDIEAASEAGVRGATSCSSSRMHAAVVWAVATRRWPVVAARAPISNAPIGLSSQPYRAECMKRQIP
jgi:uncharacterized protein YbjT (DUF2867 family)